MFDSQEDQFRKDIDETLMDAPVGAIKRPLPPSDILPSDGFPRFQMSKFIGKSRDYQIVIRTNSANDLRQAMNDIKPFIDGLEAREQDSQPQTQPNPRTQHEFSLSLEATCKVHQCQMSEGVSRKTGKPYWFHDTAEGRCFGKGVQPKSY